MNSDNRREPSTNDRSYCELLNTEIQVLHNEVKSLTEIINILNSELKTTRATEDFKIHTTPAITVKSPLFPCGNCAQLEVKLYEAQEEIDLQKLIISTLNDENKPVNQLQLTNLKINNGPNTDSGFSRPHWPKKTHFSQHTFNHEQHEQYAIPTTNRYAALYTLPDHLSGNPSPGPYQDSSPYIFPQRSKKYNLKSKTPPAAHIKDPSSITVHHNLQALEPDQEISTISTIVNGVITNGKKKSPCNKVHKVLIIGNSHMRNCAVNVKSSVKNNFLVQGVVKPGAVANILVNSAKNEVKGLSKRESYLRWCK
jgi:hypothetical protein